MPTDRLLHYVEHANKGVERNRLLSQNIERVFALRQNASAANDQHVFKTSNVARLRGKTSDELLAMKKFSLSQLKRYEQALQTAVPIVNERTR